MFLIPKEISSENKLWKSIYIKDFIIILGTLFFAWITSSAIYDGLVFQYYVFLLILSLLFILKSSTNPSKRVYQAIYILLTKNNLTYHSLDYEVGNCESFKDKYEGGGKTSGKSEGMASTNRIIPARLTEAGTKYIQDLACQTFRVLGTAGVSRIDFLIDKNTQMVYVNEINTIPGSLSFYLWEKTDLNFGELMDQLVHLALKRQRERENLTFSFESNVLALQGNGTKGSKGIKG